MRRLVDLVLRKATRTGLRRGLSGEHWAWLVVAGAAYVLQRARRPDDDPVTIDLEPGERYVVSVVPPRPSRAAPRDGA